MEVRLDRLEAKLEKLEQITAKGKGGYKGEGNNDYGRKGWRRGQNTGEDNESNARLNGNQGYILC